MQSEPRTLQAAASGDKAAVETECQGGRSGKPPATAACSGALSCRGPGAVQDMCQCPQLRDLTPAQAALLGSTSGRASCLLGRKAPGREGKDRGVDSESQPYLHRPGSGCPRLLTFLAYPARQITDIGFTLVAYKKDSHQGPEHLRMSRWKRGCSGHTLWVPLYWQTLV